MYKEDVDGTFVIGPFVACIIDGKWRFSCVEKPPFDG